MEIVMFTIGTLIFIAYMFGLLTMINRSHKQQASENNSYKEFMKKVQDAVDDVDHDGMGDFSRFPSQETKKQKVK